MREQKFEEKLGIYAIQFHLVSHLSWTTCHATLPGDCLRAWFCQTKPTKTNLERTLNRVCTKSFLFCDKPVPQVRWSMPGSPAFHSETEQQIKNIWKWSQLFLPKQTTVFCHRYSTRNTYRARRFLQCFRRKLPGATYSLMNGLMVTHIRSVKQKGFPCPI